jgi:hypothetical protein
LEQRPVLEKHTGQPTPDQIPQPKTDLRFLPLIRDPLHSVLKAVNQTAKTQVLLWTHEMLPPGGFSLVPLSVLPDYPPFTAHNTQLYEKFFHLSSLSLLD